MKKILIGGAAALGALFIALAIYYWITPAGSLPAWMPGFEAASAHVHFKHGLASLLLGLGLLIWAWFKSGSAPSAQ